MGTTQIAMRAWEAGWAQISAKAGRVRNSTGEIRQWTAQADEAQPPILSQRSSASVEFVDSVGFMLFIRRLDNLHIFHKARFRVSSFQIQRAVVFQGSSRNLRRQKRGCNLSRGSDDDGLSSRVRIESTPIQVPQRSTDPRPHPVSEIGKPWRYRCFGGLLSSSIAPKFHWPTSGLKKRSGFVGPVRVFCSIYSSW